MISAILACVAVVFIVGTTIALWRAPDALTRINLMGPTVGVAMPLLILAHLFNDPFDWHNLIRAVIAIAALWVVAAVASFYIARSVYEV